MSGDDEWEVWVACYRITERRDGCVFRTEFVDDRWVPMDQRHGDGGDLIYTVADTEHWPRRIKK